VGVYRGPQELRVNLLLITANWDKRSKVKRVLNFAARLKPCPDTKPRHDAFHKRTHPSAKDALEWGTGLFLLPLKLCHYSSRLCVFQPIDARIELCIDANFSSWWALQALGCSPSPPAAPMRSSRWPALPGWMRNISSSLCR